jgi:hypothetical protein
MMMQHEPPENRLVQTASYRPYAWGALSALLLAVVLFVMLLWFPSVGAAWDRNDRLVRDAWFTTAFLGCLIYRLWHWRRRVAFWLAMSALLVLHTLGLLFYSKHVHPLLGWQWVVLVFIESALIIFFLEWSMKRLEHLATKRRASIRP